MGIPGQQRTGMRGHKWGLGVLGGQAQCRSGLTDHMCRHIACLLCKYSKMFNAVSPYSWALFFTQLCIAARQPMTTVMRLTDMAA